MRYAGGKGVSYPHLINLMPPHTRYIETHLGGGAVMRNKHPAREQIGIDIDARVIEGWQETDLCQLIQVDAVAYLQEVQVDRNTLVYADPPYHPDTRRRARVYRHDYSADDHGRLLECLTSLNCQVMISGYPNPLYERYLSDWSVHRYNAKTHTDVREEWVWFNFDRPQILHDSRYIGGNFREREIVRRRQARLRDRIAQLPIVEQSALLNWLSDQVGAAS